MVGAVVVAVAAEANAQKQHHLLRRLLALKGCGSFSGSELDAKGQMCGKCI